MSNPRFIISFSACHGLLANPFAFRFTSATVAAPGPEANPKTNRRNLLVVTEDGKVYEVGNAPPWPPPATGP